MTLTKPQLDAAIARYAEIIDAGEEPGESIPHDVPERLHRHALEQAILTALPLTDDPEPEGR